MVDLDYLDRIDYQLRVGSTYVDNNTELIVSGDDGDKAVSFLIRDTENHGNAKVVIADKKAARMVVDFLRTYFEL